MIRQLPDYLTRAAERHPDHLAVVMGNHQLTYSELEAMTNRLARLLRSYGCRTGLRVCVVAAKTPWTITGLLAILKAGGIYVPIDSSSPAARLSRIFRAVEPSLVLADASATKLLDDLIGNGALSSRIPIGVLDMTTQGMRWEAAFTQADSARLPAGPLGGSGDSSEIAQVLFTSGSTGAPKGVVITHANITAFVEWAIGYFGMRSTDRISGHPPLHFDLSTFDIYGAFAAGAELHLVPGELNINPVGLATFIREHKLTQWFSVPSVLTYMAKFDAIAQDDFPMLERLLWCGEVLPTPVLAHWMRRLPHVRFTNLYGPTEATIASSFYTVPACPRDEAEPVPIGRPCSGEELLVLDSRLQPVAHGEIGDLYIAGTGLSPGYWEDEDRSATAFLPDPRKPGSKARIYRTGDLARVGDDQLIYFLGRTDSQIKSRGYRIELGEIEAAVNAISAVRECAVIGIETGGFEGITICCAFSLVNGAELSAPSLRRDLTKVLPSYMLPARWMKLATLPTNLNGKIDRNELRERFVESATAIARASGGVARTMATT